MCRRVDRLDGLFVKVDIYRQNLEILVHTVVAFRAHPRDITICDGLKRSETGRVGH